MAGSPGTGSPSARGLALAERGRGERGSAGKSGRARPGAPRGAAPASRGSRAAPGALAKDGQGGKVDPFCFAGPALLAPGSRATSAAAVHAAAPGSARQSRRGAGARGGPGGGRAGGPGISSARPRSRGHHFLLARRRREPGPPAAPARAALFGWGEPKRKSFAGGVARARPLRGPGAAPLPLGRRDPPSFSCSAAGRTRGRGAAPFFLSLALPQAPGQLGRGAREPGRAGASLRRGPCGVADRPQPRQRLGAVRPRGPGSPVRSQPVAARHTADSHGHRVCGSGDRTHPGSRVIFPEAAQAAVGSRRPHV